MKPRAIICDVYRTILEVRPAEGDAERGWPALGREFFGTDPVMTFGGFDAACRAVVADDHAAARRRGVAFPEVQWPEVVGRVLPLFRGLDPARRMEFLLREQSLRRGLGLASGAAAALRSWSRQGVLLGVASNAQAYTRPELEGALGAAGLDCGIFAGDLVLWSWQLGFSKPDPYFFQVLRARLAARGLAPGEALMVGDRADNDIAPARAAGLMTWHLHPEGDGDWSALQAVLER